MSSRNGKGRGGRQQLSYEELLRDDPKEMSMLDQALEDATAEHKARVRGLLLRYGIEHDNEFYMLFVAFGHLTILVEEAPENWQALFDDVHRELKQWSQQNFKSLQSIQQHAQTSADLIAVLKQLLGSMKHSDSRSAKMLESLNSFGKRLLTIEKSLAKNQTLSQRAIDRSTEHFDLLDGQMEMLGGSVGQGALISSVSLFAGVLTIGMLLANTWMMGRRLTQQEVLVRAQNEQIEWQSERIGWLYEKANRRECLEGIKPPSDPQCQQYF
ncbi:hypothetical protein S7335_845 [Synechococcus sp. PCC 7335]|uniref:DUF6753 family protein n=1 Tax=Synechococcus sp. (strain ATCC 29403 / PCC 7335) TaxID=91464 RepID=UPI00017EBCFE|nr:DUF6753 family protein [Synechococcus sp. PCC 7335]EDX82399.1 hypothetical protein S7335_845 [Synechococcus sp. PCC 7335]